MNPGRLWRTVRHIRADQLAAQALYQLGRRARPARPAGGPARLRVGEAATAFLPAPPHARFDGWRRLRLVGREVVFRERIDWDFVGEGPLWAYHMHQFDFARRPGLAPAARSRLLLDWIERHPRGTGWNPHPISLRILSWGKLLLTPGALALDAAGTATVLGSLAAQVETLYRHPERRLLANHLLSNYLGVAFGALLLDHPRAERWWRAAEALRAELRAQVHGDGLHEERSPMYHALLLENVLDLLALARSVQASAAGPGPAGALDALVTDLADTAARMLGALEALRHPDGEIALFADSAFGIAHPPAALRDFGRRLGVAPRGPDRPGVLAEGGYVQLAHDPFHLVASVAGPAPAHQPGHAHCDALAFELSVAGERVVTDSGVPEYIPGALREACRRTRAHATVEVGGHEQAEIWGAHRVGGRPAVELDAVEPGRSLEARCAGWATPDTLHRRRIELAPDAATVTDRLEGAARPVRWQLPLAPGLAPELAGREAAHLRLASGRRLTLALPAPATWRVERAPYFPEFGAHRERACLVGEGEAPCEGVLRIALADG